MRRTKIVATLGPATDSPERLAELLRAGVDVVRLNFSHGSHAEHARRIALVRAEAERQNRPVAILQDLQGPKIRTGALAGDRPVTLAEGRTLIITTRPGEGTAERVPTDYAALPQDVRPGDRILLSDGLIELRVRSIEGQDVTCEIVNGGVLRAHQGINLPGVNVSAPAVTPKDLDDLQFGLARASITWPSLSSVGPRT
jgi:pyruvate kinase